MREAPGRSNGGLKGKRRDEASSFGPIVGSSGQANQNEDDIREAAYFIWEKDQAKPADACWVEAKQRLCK